MPRATNTRFAIAVHVLTYLAGHDGIRAVSSDELAASTNANPVHVRRVLGPLRREGLVRSRPGPHGGWEIARPAAGIALDEVWALLQDGERVLGVHGPNPQCPVGQGVQRVLHGIDEGVARAVRAELAGLSVQDVVDDALHAAAPPVRSAGANGPTG